MERSRRSAYVGLGAMLAMLIGSAARTRSQAPQLRAQAAATTQRELLPPPRVRLLRLSADPNNLPFTNQKLEGFENKIAEVIARDLGAEVSYDWHAQRRGFFRRAFKEAEADVVLAVPEGFDKSLTTRPYYRSSYVFVSRADRKLGIKSLDDPALKKLKIGVQTIGDDGTNTPPVHALANRGIIDNVVGFTVYGDHGEDDPATRIVKAVADGEVDVAIVWGPVAGYYAKKQSVPLDLRALEPSTDSSGLPFAFSIAVGVRRGSREMRDEIDAILVRRADDIARILKEYGVPLLEP